MNSASTLCIWWVWSSWRDGLYKRSIVTSCKRVGPSTRVAGFLLNIQSTPEELVRIGPQHPHIVLEEPV